MTHSVPARLGHVVLDTPSDSVTLFLMELPDGAPLVLRGSAALIWILAAEGSPDVPALVSEAVGRPVEEIGDEVRDYLADLVSRRLLQESDTPSVAISAGADTPG